MTAEDISKQLEKILEMQKELNAAHYDLLGRKRFQEFMLECLYQDWFLQYSDALPAMEKLEKQTMNSLRFMELPEGENSNVAMLIQGGAIEAGEQFFTNLKERIKNHCS